MLYASFFTTSDHRYYSTDMKTISTDDALKPSGHYSQAVTHNGLVNVSGQLPFDWQTGKPIHGDASTQGAAALANLKRMFDTSGSGMDRVLKCTVYVSDMSFWPDVNAMYAQFFGKHKPATAIVPTGPSTMGSKSRLTRLLLRVSNEK